MLAVFNWSKGNDRYRRLERFVEELFAKWRKFREPPRHPKWRDVNLAATVPGWTRWSAAEEMLRRIQQKDPKVAEFGSPLRDLSQEEREALFDQFLKWREQQSGAPPQRSGAPPQRSAVPQQRSGAQPQRSAVPQQRKSVSQQRGGVPQQGSGRAAAMERVPPQRSDAP